MIQYTLDRFDTPLNNAYHVKTTQKKIPHRLQTVRENMECINIYNQHLAMLLYHIHSDLSNKI